ncbi:MAG: formiminotransferase-cyclodeaminase, partial [Candidatus Hydrothermota bacterium]
NVLINLSTLKDEEFVANARKELDNLRESFEQKFTEIIRKVEEKV